MDMDGMNENPTRKLTDHLVSAFGPAAIKGAKGKCSTSARSQKEAPIAQPLYRPLVEEDRLSFRAVTIERFYGDVRLKEMPTSPALEKDLEAFRLAFCDVWSGIPCQDRHRLLFYWRSKHDCSTEPHLPANPDRRPVILVVDAIPDYFLPQIAQYLGNMYLFPQPMLWNDPAQLRMEIATVLAWTFRVATRRRWELAIEIVEKPYEEWEKRQKGKASHDRRDRKLDALEAQHLRAYHAEMAELLGRWGCPYQPTSAG